MEILLKFLNTHLEIVNRRVGVKFNYYERVEVFDG